MFGLFLRMGGWLIVLPAFIIVAALMSSGDPGASAARLAAEGVEGTATVREVFESRPMTLRRSAPSHVVRVTFSTGSVLSGDFAVHRGEQRVSQGLWERLREGDTIPVRYLPSDPAVFEIEPGAVQAEATNLWLVAGLIALLSAPVFGMIGLGAARAARLRRTGVVVEGVAEGFVKRPLLSVLAFSYVDPAGTRHEGRTFPHRAAAFRGLEPGSPMRIVMDPKNPRTAFWAGDLGMDREPRLGGATPTGA